MAKISNNLVLQGVCGTIGKQLVVRQTYRGGVLAVVPRERSQANITGAQKAYRERFRQATAYGRGAQHRPEYQPVAKARHTSGFAVAAADFLNPPEITAIDMAEYHGQAGDRITVQAFDDVKVTTVRLSIVRDDDSVVEAGELAQVDFDLTCWTYVATQDAGCHHVRITVEAVDLARHVTRQSMEAAC